MVAAKFGKADPDVRMKGSKETRDGPLKGMGDQPGLSAMVGGISNRTSQPSAKKKKGAMSLNFAKGGKVLSSKDYL